MPFFLATALAAHPRLGNGQNGSGEAASSQDEQRASSLTSHDPKYVIGPTDVLDINFWGEKDLSRTVLVRHDGKTSLPLLGDLQAAGLTPMELAASIADKMRKYITDPRVTVTPSVVNSRRVYVVGEVNRPGTVALLPDMTVLQALASAGGLNQFANRKRIYVLRTENGKQVRYPYNYKEVIRGTRMDQNIRLLPGDTIVIP